MQLYNNEMGFFGQDTVYGEGPYIFVWHWHWF